LPIDESAVSRPTNAYGLSKLLSERMLDEMCRMHAGEGLTAVSMRLPFVMSQRGFEFNVGRRAPSEQLWGASEAFMYVHAEDAAEAALLACGAEGIEGHEVVWIVAPDPRPPDAIEELATRALGGIPGVEACAERGSFVDTSKAERVLGWRAARVLREARAGAAS
jgi:nucleoside-diphosphate-sugar epimerase